MELKSLILGLVFSVGIFAVKSGAGLSYPLVRQARLAGKLGVLAGYGLGYGLVFGFAWILLTRINLPDHLETVMHLFQSGMTMHFVLALLLLLRGIVLLGRREKNAGQASHGWLFLSLPCPVCLSVIVMSCAFLHSFFPENRWIFLWLFAGFILISLATALVLSGQGQGRPEKTLGTVMVLAALYFLITIAVVPQFADVERIYRLSRASGLPLADRRLPMLAVGCVLAFGVGFIKTVWRRAWK